MTGAAVVGAACGISTCSTDGPAGLLSFLLRRLAEDVASLDRVGGIAAIHPPLTCWHFKLCSI